MKSFLLVFLGGGLGSSLRYLASKFINTHNSNFPYGTITVNIVGSFLIGLVIGFAIKNNNLSNNYTLLLATGFCGGFTTFSAFAYENYAFLKSGDYLNFGVYTLGSILLGLLAVFIGMWLVKFF